VGDAVAGRIPPDWYFCQGARSARNSCCDFFFAWNTNVPTRPSTTPS
jgi:hypothetical protein